MAKYRIPKYFNWIVNNEEVPNNEELPTEPQPVEQPNEPQPVEQPNDPQLDVTENTIPTITSIPLSGHVFNSAILDTSSIFNGINIITSSSSTGSSRIRQSGEINELIQKNIKKSVPNIEGNVMYKTKRERNFIERTIDVKQVQEFVDSIIEQKELVFSKKLVNQLNKMRDPISQYLIYLHDKNEFLDIDFTYLDTAEDGLVSFLPMKKKGVSETEVWVNKSRQKTKVGRLLTSVANKTGVVIAQNDIDTFISKFKAVQRIDDCDNIDFADWVLIQENDFIKYYNGRNYHPSIDGGDTLNKSCMRYEECRNYLHIYTHTPNVQLLCLIAKKGDYKGKLMGRAVVWNNIDINGVKGTFMDRIYVCEGPLEETFKSYAEKRGWWYKTSQNPKASTPITNGYEVKDVVMEFPIANDVDWMDFKNNLVPYMDTMKYLHYKQNSETNELVPYLTTVEENSKSNWSYNHGGFCYDCDGKGHYIYDYDGDDDSTSDIDGGIFSPNSSPKKRVQEVFEENGKKFIKESCNQCKATGRR